MKTDYKAVVEELEKRLIQDAKDYDHGEMMSMAEQIWGRQITNGVLSILHTLIDEHTNK